MNLEIFEHISEVLDAYGQKKDVYKLIAEEVKEFFEQKCFTESDYDFSMTYRIKSAESIREKLIRNNYVVQRGNAEEIIANFQDILGFRVECKFVEEEDKAWDLLNQCFTRTEDDEYYYMPAMPKVRLKLSDKQPQSQKNGFDIYKIDGLYMLGKENIRFELQIKSLVNVFWGEIEHRVVYKNNDYLLADSFVSDMLKSIKQNLNMIDEQLYTLYLRFKENRELSGAENGKAKGRAIEIFAAGMVYETFEQMLLEQMGFTIDFKDCCDAIVRYLIDVNEADDMEEYGQMMLYIFDILNDAPSSVRLDEQIEFERACKDQDAFCASLIETTLDLININYRWHLYFTIMFSLTAESNAYALEECMRFYKQALCQNRSLALLKEVEEDNNTEEIADDLLMQVAKTISEQQLIEYFCAEGMSKIHRGLNYIIPVILSEFGMDQNWAEIKDRMLSTFAEKIRL